MALGSYMVENGLPLYVSLTLSPPVLEKYFASGDVIP